MAIGAHPDDIEFSMAGTLLLLRQAGYDYIVVDSPSILDSADVKERYAKAGYAATSSTPEELRKRYEQWMAIFGKIAKDANIKPQ